MIAVDNTFLTLLLHPLSRPPRDPDTGQPVDRLDERIELLIETLEQENESIIIPAPVLTEFLILADKDGPRYLTDIDSHRRFRVESFDQRAAVELAAINLSVRAAGGGRRGDMTGTYAKITFDRQSVAIAVVNTARVLYSDDENVEKFAKRCGLPVVKTWELPVPEEKHPLLRLSEAKGYNDEEESSNGAGAKAIEADFSGVRQLPASSAEISVSPEAGSGAGEGEAGKG
ncbi:MAG: hypothetical protein QOD28_1120 [Acidobacteriota bacterium]|nr:hypothetical protein [Acidobacteriota bacterium]